MTSPENQHPEQANSGSVNSEEIVEYKLNPGARYGCWENNDPDPKKRDVAMVHGAVNDCRTRVLLDTGATVNILSFDLARKLGLTLKSHKQTKVSGMGGVPTYIGASAQRIAWVSTCPWKPHLAPGESKVVKISYGPTNPPREVVWAGRGDRWVTHLIYAARRWPATEKVVKISDKDVWIHNRTLVARIVEYGFFPRAGRFARPGSFAYREWQTLILESVQSREGRLRAERLDALEPSCVKTPEYQWPTKILSRPAKGPDLALLASILRKPKTRRVRFAEDAATQTEEVPPEDPPELRDVAIDTSDLGDVLKQAVTDVASQAVGTPSA
ncbi:aspartic protease [Phytophthora sojae]|uniref:Aspartic protease n=1 Tax=Phytophthora sojae (strain P6497) TaxID=1094619 RepID=G4Z946_PHYSP|nr:aspartic protease [Phytophthora sojae]EGZ21100.1 aspartic protease [Phytophthora sojae]|eukprot:XP_009523817.1 aspartic protease [Phytophthora sojae]